MAGFASPLSTGLPWVRKRRSGVSSGKSKIGISAIEEITIASTTERVTSAGEWWCIPWNRIAAMAVKCRPEIPTTPIKMPAATRDHPALLLLKTTNVAAEPIIPITRESSTVGQSYSTGTGKRKASIPV